MSQTMTRSNPISPAALDKIIGFLAPLFVVGGQYDLATATETASQMLASYGARTNKEMRLAALTIAFSFGALASLGQSVAVELSVTQILRLRGNANALHRAAHKSQEALDQLQAASPEPAAEPNTEEPSQDLPASAEVPDLIVFTRPAPMSRQMRRHAERQAENTRLRQQEAARQSARGAERSAARQSA